MTGKETTQALVYAWLMSCNDSFLKNKGMPIGMDAAPSSQKKNVPCSASCQGLNFGQVIGTRSSSW
jgi:hypothetical protein